MSRTSSTERASASALHAASLPLICGRCELALYDLDMDAGARQSAARLLRAIGRAVEERGVDGLNEVAQGLTRMSLNA